MRLEALFEDLESQFEAMQDGDLYGEVADRIRAEVGKITVLDRLRGAVGTVVGVTAAGNGEMLLIAGLAGKRKISLTDWSWSSGVLTATW